MAKRLLFTIALVLLGTACAGDGTSSESTSDQNAPATTTGGGLDETDPSPPALPDDFTWSGRYVVPDLDVDVPFTWNGADGDFQMVAGGTEDPIHFTNLIVDGELYTFTYKWPDVKPTTCSHVGPFTVDEFNEGLADASYVGREIHAPDRVVDHFRSVGVLEIPEGVIPELDEITTLRLPLMAGDIYVDADDHTTFRKVLHFGVQNLYDPDLDEWIVIEEAEPVAGEVELPDECVPTP